MDQLSPERRRALWVEVWVVCAAAVLPDFASALQAYFSDFEYPPEPFALSAVMLMVRSVSVISVVLWIMSRDEGGLAAFGVTRPRILDAVLALPVYLLTMAATIGAMLTWMVAIPPGVDRVLDDLGPQGAVFAGPSAWWDGVLLGLMSLLNGFAEELVICAFLVTRLERLMGSVAWAILASSALFASYHVYQGVYNAYAIFWIGLATTTVFAASRRIWPVALAHAAADILAYAAAEGGGLIA